MKVTTASVLLLASVLPGFVLPAPAAAQVPADDPRVPVWAAEFGFLGANALVGGLTAGILQQLRGGSFQDGFTRGALGGAIAYGGRRLAVEDFWGAGLVGRQVSAIGASAVRNAAEQRRTFSRLGFVLGPLLVDIHRDQRSAVRLRVDAYTTVWMLSAFFDNRLEFDWESSLSAAAPVFRAPRHRLELNGDTTVGRASGGLILLGYRADSKPGSDVLAHEKVHGLQHDFARELWSAPLERWIAGLLPGGPTVFRLVEPGVAYSLILGGLVAVFDVRWRDRPWEMEAEFLEHR